MKKGDKVIVKYQKCDIPKIEFGIGKIYDRMVGTITLIERSSAFIKLTKSDAQRVRDFNKAVHAGWTTEPNIPLEYLFDYKVSKILETE